MNTREKKLIELKVLLSVQDIHELSKESRLYKKHGISILQFKDDSLKGVQIVSPFARELSWMFYQLTYIFGENPKFVLHLATSLAPHLEEAPELKELTDALIAASIDYSKKKS